MYNLGIDLGGTFIKAGVVDSENKIKAKFMMESHVDTNVDGLCARMIECAKTAVDEAGLTMNEIEHIGVCVPGAVDSVNGVVVYCSNIKFRNTPLAAMIKERTGKPVFVHNDANAAAYGEVVAGAAQGCKDVIVVTLGTGVGGGVIINGKIYAGFNSFGGELGHTVIVHNGEPCPCGRRGCLESYASATALIKQTREAMKNHTESRLWQICPDISQINGKTAFDAMREGSKAGAEVVNRYINYLGCGLTNFINVFQPEMLLIGGGVSKEGETLLEPLRKILAVETYGSGMDAPKTKIGVCTLRNDAGTIGAANLYRLYEND